jgi:anti-sigma-K factor RskA
MSDFRTIDPGEGDFIAAEYVLGVLGATERREVERRLAREPALAAEVAFWEERLCGLADAVEPAPPPQDAWSRIESAIAETAPRTGGRPSVWQSLAFWRGLAIGSSTLAASCVAALAYMGMGMAPGPQGLMATLGGDAGQPNFVATVTGNNVVIVPAALLASERRSYELWLIPAGETRPRSLGLIEAGHPIRLDLHPGVAGRITAAAALAVSLEPAGGSPTGEPTGPIIARGKLTDL